jgi:hypothetical protein
VHRILLTRGHKRGQDLQSIRPYLNNGEQDSESYRFWLGSGRKNSACELRQFNLLLGLNCFFGKNGHSVAIFIDVEAEER